MSEAALAIRPTPSHPRRPSASLSAPLGDANVKRLLVVDDEEGIRTVLGRYLKGRGYDVLTASGAQAAIDLLDQQRFSLLICDVRMPGMTGVELVPKAHDMDPEL